MNNRNYEIKVRLTQAEMVHLNRLVNGSKLSRKPICDSLFPALFRRTHHRRITFL